MKAQDTKLTGMVKALVALVALVAVVSAAADRAWAEGCASTSGNLACENCPSKLVCVNAGCSWTGNHCAPLFNHGTTAGVPTLSTAWLDIEGEVSHPPNPCMPGGVGDAVALSGMAHVLTKVLPAPTGDSIMVHINLADVMGTGVPSGMTYHAVGAFGVEFPPSPFPPDPCISISAAFDLVQAGACPAAQGGAPVSGALCFNSDWTLDAGKSSLRFESPGN